MLIEDIPLEKESVRGIIYYSDVSFTDMGWLDEEQAKKEEGKEAGVQPVDINRVGSIAFKYAKDIQELSMRFEENDEATLMEIATMFAKTVFNATINEKGQTAAQSGFIERSQDG